MEYYLAVDIGASSGRHILGSVENGKMKLEEIYRFENGFYVKNGSKYWDTERLFGEIVNGMKKCREIGKIPKSIAIDTWGVDYALLDADGNLTDDVFCYRDSRTDGMAEESSKTFSSVIDANDEGFLAPDNMTEQIRSFCKNSGQKVPETVGEIAYAVYQGLAECYAKCAAVIEENTGKTYDCINIIGGGSNADYLNRLTAAASGKKVRAGIGEATSVGNIAAQAIRAGALSDLADARSCIFNSFAIKEYE